MRAASLLGLTTLLIGSAGCGASLHPTHKPQGRARQESTAELGGRTPAQTPIDARSTNDPQLIELYEHDQMTLPSTGVASFSVTGDAIAVSVDPVSTDFVIQAVSAGSGSLLLLHAGGKRVLIRIDVLSRF